MVPTRGFKENGQWDAKEKKDYARDENGERIPVIDPATGEQKLDSRNRKQWKRVTVQANDWNSQENAEIWRANWAKACNQYLAPENQIDHRSYARQGKDEIPTIHEGYAARQIEARGEVSDRCEYNRKVKESKRFLAWIKAEYAKVEMKIREITHKIKEQLEAHKQQAQQQSTGYKSIDDLLKRAGEKQKQQAQEQKQTKSPGRDDHTLTH